MHIKHLKQWLHFRRMISVTQRRFGDMDRRTCEFIGVLLVIETIEGRWSTVEDLVIGAESVASPRTIRRYLNEFIKRDLAVREPNERIIRLKSTTSLDEIMENLIKINVEWLEYMEQITNA